ncbi:MAG: hypothetical protein ACC662_09890, partial [Planctomycetota bacterium]
TRAPAQGVSGFGGARRPGYPLQSLAHAAPGGTAPMNPLTPLEDAAFRYVLAHAHESDGWLDLTRICSATGRMLPDVRQAIARLARRDVLEVDSAARNTERWIRFVLPSQPERRKASAPSRPAP